MVFLMSDFSSSLRHQETQEFNDADFGVTLLLDELHAKSSEVGEGFLKILWVCGSEVALDDINIYFKVPSQLVPEYEAQEMLNHGSSIP